MTADATDTYDIDDSGGFGRRFDGIGGISGGGVSLKKVCPEYRCHDKQLIVTLSGVKLSGKAKTKYMCFRFQL